MPLDVLAACRVRHHRRYTLTLREASWQRQYLQSDSSNGLTVVFDEADFMLAGVRTKGGKSSGMDNPAASILNTRAGTSAAPRHNSIVWQSCTDHTRNLCFATVPGQGSSSIGAYLEKRFQRCSQLRSSGAHRPVGSLTKAFR